jgi:hypothetical protein
MHRALLHQKYIGDAHCSEHIRMYSVSVE